MKNLYLVIIGIISSLLSVITLGIFFWLPEASYFKDLIVERTVAECCDIPNLYYAHISYVFIIFAAYFLIIFGLTRLFPPFAVFLSKVSLEKSLRTSLIISSLIAVALLCGAIFAIFNYAHTMSNPPLGYPLGDM